MRTRFSAACRVAVCALAFIPGCGGSERATWTTYNDTARGFSVRVPSAWHRASERMSRITDPWELLSVGTAPLRWQQTNCEAFAGAAAMSMRSGDVVVTVWERGTWKHGTKRAFPARPSRFGPVADAQTAGPGCGEPAGTIIHWRDFGDAGRRFHSLVRIAPDAPPQDVARAWRVLDSLELTRGRGG